MAMKIDFLDQWKHALECSAAIPVTKDNLISNRTKIVKALWKIFRIILIHNRLFWALIVFYGAESSRNSKRNNFHKAYRA